MGGLVKNDLRNSGGTLRQKFNHLTFDVQPMDQWSNGSMVKWTNVPMDQWSNGPIDQWTQGLIYQWSNSPMV